MFAAVRRPEVRDDSALLLVIVNQFQQQFAQGILLRRARFALLQEQLGQLRGMLQFLAARDKTERGGSQQFGVTTAIEAALNSRSPFSTSVHG